MKANIFSAIIVRKPFVNKLLNIHHYRKILPFYSYLAESVIVSEQQ